MKHNKGNTNNTLLVIILVITVGFVVWYVTAQKQADRQNPGVQINLGSGTSGQ